MFTFIRKVSGGKSTQGLVEGLLFDTRGAYIASLYISSCNLIIEHFEDLLYISLVAKPDPWEPWDFYIYIEYIYTLQWNYLNIEELCHFILEMYNTA